MVEAGIYVNVVRFWIRIKYVFMQHWKILEWSKGVIIILKKNNDYNVDP